MEPRESEIDLLLRRSMSGPVPSLPSDFEQRLMLEVRRSSGPLDRYRLGLLVGYGLVSVAASAGVMRDQGLDWGTTTGMILGPLALVAAVWSVRRTIRTVGRS